VNFLALKLWAYYGAIFENHVYCH
jgi:hypothetical protein